MRPGPVRSKSGQSYGRIGVRSLGRSTIGVRGVIRSEGYTAGYTHVNMVVEDIQIVKTATEVEVRAIQDHKVIEWNTYWKCRLSKGTDDI